MEIPRLDHPSRSLDRLVFRTKDTMLFYLIRSILIFCSLHLTLVHSLICSQTTYGTPNPDDCAQALLEIPFAKNTMPSGEARLFHLFTEPQFQLPPFHRVTNNFRPQAIIQLPKFWKHSTSQHPHFTIDNPPCCILRRTNRTSISESCRIALMSRSPGGSSKVVGQRFSAGWAGIIDRSAQLRGCLAFSPARGGWTTMQSKYPSNT